MPLFARNEEANAFLAQNPLILGLGAVVLAAILTTLGVVSLIRGRAPTKFGEDATGKTATVLAFVWLGFGGLCMMFGCFKIISSFL